MVERRPWLDALSHLILFIGVLVIAFPVYITFVASTHTSEAVVQSPMPMLPGAHLLDNYATALSVSAWAAAPMPRWGRMMVVSLVTALVISLGKISISLLSAFALVYFRFPFRMAFFWAIFVTLMLPVEVRIGPDLQGGGGSGPAQHLCGFDGAVDRIGHSHIFVPPVLPDRAR
jgi:sn-glycerol 3-phosphate transport system permease protein